jgi:hypothetical protein
VKKMVNYEEAGVVPTGKLEEGGVGPEKMETVVIPPDETGNLAADSIYMRFW